MFPSSANKIIEDTVLVTRKYCIKRKRLGIITVEIDFEGLCTRQGFSSRNQTRWRCFGRPKLSEVSNGNCVHATRLDHLELNNKDI